MKKLTFFVRMTMLLLTITGCSKSTPITIIDLLSKKVPTITQINIRYENGQLVTIQDTETVNRILKKLEDVVVHKVADSEVAKGYHYFIDFTDGTNAIRMDSNLKINKTQYATDTSLDELNRIILSLEP